MAGLQRSQLSFRRQGSSGMVWDDKFLKKLAEENPAKTPDDDDHDQSKRKSLNTATASPQKSKHDGANEQLRRSKSTTAAYRTVKVSDADQEELPSPRLKGCGFCGVFGKTAMKKQNKKNSSAAKKDSDYKSYIASGGGGGRRETTKGK